MKNLKEYIIESNVSCPFNFTEIEETPKGILNFSIDTKKMQNNELLETIHRQAFLRLILDGNTWIT